jgi:hypothetical protein
MKKIRYKIALLKRKFHLRQKARVERKLFALRKRLLDISAVEES